RAARCQRRLPRRPHRPSCQQSSAATLWSHRRPDERQPPPRTPPPLAQGAHAGRRVLWRKQLSRDPPFAPMRKATTLEVWIQRSSLLRCTCPERAVRLAPFLVVRKGSCFHLHPQLGGGALQGGAGTRIF